MIGVAKQDEDAAKQKYSFSVKDLRVEVTQGETIQEILRLGAEGDFWELLLKALKDSKKQLKKLLDDDDPDLPAEMYKFERELLKAKVEYIDKLLKLPETLIVWLENPNNIAKDFDPYEKPNLDEE